jgi:general stress protein YciG
MRRNLISEVMREMGKKGGKAAGGKGGRKRMAALSPEERKELARKAAKARWAIAKNVKRVRKRKDKRVRP